MKKDLLNWLKYAQSETTWIKLGFSKAEVAEMAAQIEAAWQESVEEEVKRRLGCARTPRSEAASPHAGSSTLQLVSK